MNTKMQNEKPEMVPSSGDDDDIILSQQLFCTPDYLTPEDQFPLKGFHSNIDKVEEDSPCPKSPEKPYATKTKRCRMDDGDTLRFTDDEPVVELGSDHNEPFVGLENHFFREEDYYNKLRTRTHVSSSAIALRCSTPLCIRNSFLKSNSEEEEDIFRSQTLEFDDLIPSIIGRNGLSRYLYDFRRIKKIGKGNFNEVFKVLKRLDGCMYAVKCTIKRLRTEPERLKAFKEVQSLAAIGFHKNIVRYYSSWIEDEQMYTQMEFCDHNLSSENCSTLLTERHEMDVLYQVSSALQFIHEKGIAHLHVKPENIYVKDGIYKLGGFGCATLLDNSLLVEEGDARYMPLEILNKNYDHLDKADIFSLGASMFDIIRRSHLPKAETEFSKLKEGKVPHLPGVTVQFQNLLQVMMDPDPLKRPSASEILGNSIFRGSLKMT
ncbi:wee1-like protein kinase isoform X1 [Vigna radiata var. radiata]|uniref:Wee1-like protein kinase isoform X1 n=1 Tax=Vigna radiata var. radiata TaxID=3916 RepID=A0A1S3VZ80_VIGRR|nr:wee1-like protein kinase isoform X1 [Vigna radiata var. radiata]